jgi:ubiquitin carboxyl-terminal hydrolase L5
LRALKYAFPLPSIYTYLTVLSPAHGIIFLFRWKPESDEATEPACPEGVWFANQVIDNACGTIALLNVIFNSSAILSEDLRNLKDFTSTLPPSMRGLAVANNAQIRDFHNSFARRQEKMAVDVDFAESAKEKPKLNVKSVGEVNEDDQDTYHFIAYVHVEDTMYELDGLKKQPVKIRKLPIPPPPVISCANNINRVLPQGGLDCPRRRPHPRACLRLRGRRD